MQKSIAQPLLKIFQVKGSWSPCEVICSFAELLVVFIWNVPSYNFNSLLCPLEQKIMGFDFLLVSTIFFYSPRLVLTMDSGEEKFLPPVLKPLSSSMFFICIIYKYCPCYPLLTMKAHFLYPEY